MDWALNYLLFRVKWQLSHKDFEGLRVKNLKTECSCGFYDLFWFFIMQMDVMLCNLDLEPLHAGKINI